MGYKAHVFETKEEADSAMSVLNEHHGLPVEGGLTQFDERSYHTHEGGFYIPYTENWTDILGQPVEIDLPTIILK